ncbi:hypothetical protein DBA29_16375 [Xenophilus aerolatus]|nr:hypothetical protein [Xenophilus aerolatus]
MREDGRSRYDFEGALIRGNQVIATNDGCVVDGPSNYPHASILDNHFNASRTGVTISRMAEVLVHGNLIYKQLGGGIGTGVNVVSSANYFSIQHNIFENLNAAVGMNVIVVSSGDRGLTANNVTRRANGLSSGTGTGVWLTSGATNCTVGANTFNDTLTPYLNQGTSNRVRDNGSTAGQFWATDELGDMRQWGSAVVSLNASGDGSVTLPKNFAGTHYPTISNGDPAASPTAAFIANQASSGIGNIAFSVRPNPGAITVRVNYQTNGKG